MEEEVHVVDSGVSLFSKIKSIATLVTAIGALLTALGSYLVPTDNTMTQATYVELSTEIKRLSDENIRQADTISGLRGALEVIIRTQQYSEYAPKHQQRLLVPSQGYFGNSYRPLSAPEVILPEVERPHEYKPRPMEQLK